MECENTKAEFDENKEKETNITDKENYIDENITEIDNICTGIYSGTAVILENIIDGTKQTGILTIELKNDKTFELTKENILGVSGTFEIVENALLLKTTPDLCNSETGCLERVTQLLDISEDCSTIKYGYGSYFFDPNFTLTRN